MSEARDIAKVFRHAAESWRIRDNKTGVPDLFDEAADQIERLIDDVQRLTEQRDHYMRLAHDLCRDEGQELTDDMRTTSEVNDEWHRQQGRNQHEKGNGNDGRPCLGIRPDTESSSRSR